MTAKVNLRTWRYKRVSFFRCYFWHDFNILLTLHLSTTLVNDQLDAQLLYFIIRLLQSSTCFEQRSAYHQEVNCINTAIQFILNLHTGRPPTESDYIRCFISTI